jgi:acyl-CoA synthetase (AMP-forming)/AMP-acid ligase II
LFILHEIISVKALILSISGLVMEDWNIANTLTAVATRRPERTGLIVPKGGGSRQWTFSDLHGITDAFAHRLVAAGIARGDRVVLMVRPSVEFICLTFALFKVGAVVVLIDPGMGYRNLLRCIAQVRPVGFIGIPRAHIFRTLFPKPFVTVRTSICVGFSGGLFGRSLDVGAVFPAPSATARKPFPVGHTAKDDPAAVLFTTGSTGPPKGVRYDHSVFFAQLRLIRDYFGITARDIDQPAFPLFGLFSTALGACAVIPEMNPSQPARVNPAKFIRTIREHGVTYSFGSPAIWRVVSRYCLQNNIKLNSLNKVLMAGAPVPGELIRVTRAVLPAGAEIYTPYGATECLPVSSITATEILSETWELTRQGKGTCVGRPIPGNQIRIIPISERPVRRWREGMELPAGETGEIVVKGPVATRCYENNEPETDLAKIEDTDGFWHRMGDVGYVDEKNRLWFCGRRAHRVVARDRTYYTICCEAVVNEHPAVFRSALVGIGEPGEQVPVIIIEPHKKHGSTAALLAEVRELAGCHPLTDSIEHFLVHPAFPVDIRHNAKIFREKLARWAAGRIRSGGDS